MEKKRDREAEKCGLRRWKKNAGQGVTEALDSKLALWWSLPPTRREEWLQKGAECAVLCSQKDAFAWMLRQWAAHHASVGISLETSEIKIHKIVVMVMALAVQRSQYSIVRAYIGVLTDEELLPEVGCHLFMLSSRCWETSFRSGLPPLAMDQVHFSHIMRCMHSVRNKSEAPPSHHHQELLERLLEVATTFDPAAIDAALQAGATNIGRALQYVLRALEKWSLNLPHPRHPSIDHLLRLLKVGLPDFPDLPCWLFVQRCKPELNIGPACILRLYDGAPIPPTLQLLVGEAYVAHTAQRSAFFSVLNEISGPERRTVQLLEDDPRILSRGAEKERAMRRQMAAEWWALVALFTDEMITFCAPSLPVSPNLARFSTIARVLHHDLQITLCLRMFGLAGDVITAADLRQATIAVLAYFFVV